MKKRMKRISNVRRAKNLRDAVISCFQETFKIARKFDQDREQFSHANAHQSYKSDRVFFSSSNAHYLNLDLFVRLTHAVAKARRSLLSRAQQHSWKHAQRRKNARLSSIVRRFQDLENSDEMINENRFTFSILANDRMSRVISLN